MNILHARNYSDGKASLKRQKSPETTTDTQDLSKFYWWLINNFDIYENNNNDDKMITYNNIDWQHIYKVSTFLRCQKIK